MGGGVIYPWLLNNINSDIERLPVYHDSEGDYIIVPDTVYETDQNRIFGGYVPMQGLISNGELIAVRTDINFATAGSRINISETLLGNGNTSIDGFGLLATYYIKSPTFWHFKGTITTANTITAIPLVGYTEGSLVNELDRAITFVYRYLDETAFFVVDNKPHCLHSDLSPQAWCDKYYECYDYVDTLQSYQNSIVTPLIFAIGYGYIRIHASFNGEVADNTINTEMPIVISLAEKIESVALLITAILQDGRPGIRRLECVGLRVNGVDRLFEASVIISTASLRTVELPIDVRFSIRNYDTEYVNYINDYAFVQGQVG